MKSHRIAGALVLLCAPLALAGDDDPAKRPAPAPGDGSTPVVPAPEAKPEPKPEVKKERKVDPAAQKALDRHAGLVVYPMTVGLKDIAAKGEFCQGEMTIGVNPKWTAIDGFDFDVALPKQIIDQATEQGATEEQAAESVKAQLQPLVGLYGGVNAVFEVPGKNWVHYDVALKQEGDDQVVELTPFDDKADAENRRYVFGKDGLLKSTSLTPKLDPDDPQAQMMAGITFEVEWTYEKKGERSLIVGRSLSIGPQTIDTKFTYYDGPNGSFLPKEAVLALPQGDQPVTFHDYTVDGKLVESTKAAAKPAEAKPAEKPAETPPVPAPVPAPAPKDGDK